MRTAPRLTIDERYVRHGLDGARRQPERKDKRMRDGQAAEEGEEHLTDDQFLR
jgi:hypothetical protein